MGKQHYVSIFYASHRLFCFSMQASLIAWALFKELYYWGQDLSSLFSQLTAYLPPRAKTSVKTGTQMIPVTPAILCSNLPPSPLSTGKERKRGQCSKPEVEILPFRTPCLPTSFPHQSHRLKLPAVSSEHAQSSACGEAGCLSISLVEMASDPLDAFPQRQLERFPMFTTFFQI